MKAIIYIAAIGLAIATAGFVSAAENNREGVAWAWAMAAGAFGLIFIRAAL